jgi:hypothetical protein
MFGCLFDVLMTFSTGGLWLIWVVIRQRRRNHCDYEQRRRNHRDYEQWHRNHRDYKQWRQNHRDYE